MFRNFWLSILLLWPNLVSLMMPTLPHNNLEIIVSLLTRFVFSVVSLIQVTAIAKTSMLSRVYPLQTQDHGFTSLDPILSDDDDDDDGGGGGGGGGGSISSSSGGGGGDCDGGGYSSVGDKEVNTLTTQMVAMKVGDCAAQHSMSSQAYTISGMYVS